LSAEHLALLKTYEVKTVEVGVQSMTDQILSSCDRGHSAKDTISAISRLHSSDFEIGLHLMIGLPGDSLDLFLSTLGEVIKLRPHFVRIHPTLVLKGAPLEGRWRSGNYLPLSLEEAVRWLKLGLLVLARANIRVARVGLQPSQELEDHLLAGPYHPSLCQLVQSAISLDLAVHLLRIAPKQSSILFSCHPKDVSTLRGQRNRNVQMLKERFRLEQILIRSRNDVCRGSLILETPDGNLTTSTREFVHDQN